MDFSTPCPIHQLHHAFNTSLPSHHSRLQLGCKINLNSRNPSINHIVQKTNTQSSKASPIITLTFQTLKLNVNWRGEKSLYPKPLIQLDFLQIPNTPSPPKLEHEIIPTKDVTKIQAPTTKLFRYIWMNFPNPTSKLLINKTSTPQTPSPTFHLPMSISRSPPPNLRPKLGPWILS